MEYWLKHYTQVYTQIEMTKTFAPHFYIKSNPILYIYIYIKQKFKLYTSPSENEQY